MTSEPLNHAAWTLVPADEQSVTRLSHEAGLSRTVSRVLVSRGITDAQQAARFFSPSLDRDWDSPSAIPGMDQVAEAVAQQVRDGRHIVVFGDFDLDGISAAAVATRGLAAMGARVSAFVPH
ncbi:MAG: single-stranded-DNA-specific exonuclease RecJ, partial [Actinobacteria bacterium]